MDPSMAMTSPIHNLLDGEEMQTPAKPSHEYGLFKQQTGLPPGSITGLLQQQSGISDAGPFQSQPIFSSSGLGEPSMLVDNTMFDPNPSWNTGLNEGSMMFDMFDPSPSQNFVDPSTITQEPVAPFKVWPGMHQQAAAAKAEQQRPMLLSQQRQRTAAAAETVGAAVSAAADDRREHRVSNHPHPRQGPRGEQK
jgi:bZIP-type transcription factor MBZ1